MQVNDFITADDLERRMRMWLEEDLGQRGDISSALLIPESDQAQAAFHAREAGIICGLPIVQRLIELFDKNLGFTANVADGAAVSGGECIARLSGNYRALLSVERTALNILSRLSGIASAARKYADVLAQSAPGAVVCATRKTIPGLRGLEKYACACGGADPHRMGLYDAVMIKDNHLGDVAHSELEARLKALVADGEKLSPQPGFITVEVDRLNQLEPVLKSGVTIVLLDNMSCADMRKAVELRNLIAPQVKLEASGGVTLEKLPEIGKTGVDRVSVGALTHSARHLDIALDFERRLPAA